MSEEPGAFIPAPASSTLSWSQVWINAITRPSVETYEGFVRDPRASANRAYLWVLISGAIVALISSLLRVAFPGTTGFGFLERPDSGSMVGSPILIFLCGIPLGAVFSVIGLVIGAGITQLIARALGGTGTYDKLVYAIAAYLAPLSIVSSLIGSIPFVMCLSPILGIYGIVLNVIAVKAVNQFDWGKAIISSLAILAIVIIIAACVTVVVLALLGPAIGNVFSNIMQGLGTPGP